MQRQIEKVFKALADSTRLEILGHLIHVKEMPCQELMKKFALSQPTLSHHFNKMVDAQILNSRREGVLWFYSINTAYLSQIGIDVKKLVRGKK